MFIPATAARAARTGSTSGKTTIGFLPPSSRLTFLISSAAPRSTARPVGTEPVKAIRGTSGCATSAAPAVAPRPVTTLSTPGRQQVGGDPGQLERGQRGLLTRLDDDRVAGGQRRGRLAGGELERVVERDDPADDAVGLPLGPRQRVGQRRAGDAPGLRGDPGEEADLLRRLRDVPAHAGQRVARVADVEAGQVLGLVGDPVGELAQQRRAALPAERRPRRGGLAGGGHRGRDVLGAGVGDRAEDLLGRRVDRLEHGAGGGRHPRAADVHQAGGLDQVAHRGAVRTWTTATSPAWARATASASAGPSFAGSVTVSAAQHP